MSFRNVRENFMLTWPYSFPLQLPLICRRSSSLRKGLSFVLKMKMQAKVKNLKRIVFQGIFNFIVTQFELFWFSSLSYLIILSKFFVNETLWEVILNYRQNFRICGIYKWNCKFLCDSVQFLSDQNVFYNWIEGRNEKERILTFLELIYFLQSMSRQELVC